MSFNHIGYVFKILIMINFMRQISTHSRPLKYLTAWSITLQFAVYPFNILYEGLLRTHGVDEYIGFQSRDSMHT